ncbi:hypothetical protein PHYSODRAFT_503065 [Phytophthora sojae]|uniref:Tyr recombinase domain-containing protein n=1 Tax=Phytophthora sojae (strain P6497) TaxID=1094619 RepID=G4ZHH4_PHYSP|nr:hypothetical protein PHYSODRAFT_503065 [Phytophthora sojae]EGZ18054.1 hypothetical protein PHYSODRAFT_503065 [Phytophthora sojae]|eukprot:XP_009527112.1 hypothetical protein PHYSODRAFT_503065 [Phytophthora sojae]
MAARRPPATFVPAHPFATYCWKYGWGKSGSGNSASTVLSKVSHIAWHHRRTLGYNVGFLPGHQLAITGMRRKDPSSKPKSPVTSAILKCLHELLDFAVTQHRVIWGASVLGFVFLLRRSEYLAQGSRMHNCAIRRADVNFVDARGHETRNLHDMTSVILQFRGSKSDQFGKGTSRELVRSGHRWCCPVLAAWYLVRHHEALRIDAGELLCKVDASHNLQVSDVVRAIKAAAGRAGHNPQDYASHSLRSGGATALFIAGFDSLAVKLFGRWKSDAVERYTRISGQLTSRMASQMLQKPALHQV